MDVSKLSPNVQKVVADGKITAQEFNGLTAAEKAELEAAFQIKEAPAEGKDISLVREAPAPKQESGNWWSRWGKKVAIGLGVVAGVAAVGALAMFAGPAIGAVAGKVAAGIGGKLGIAAILGGAAIYGTSCALEDRNNPDDPGLTPPIPEDPNKPLVEVHTVIVVNVTVSVIVENTGLDPSTATELKEIIDLLRETNGNLDAIKDRLDGLEMTVSQFLKYLLQIGQSAGDIIKLLQENNMQNDKIIELLSNGNEEIIKYLKEIFDAVQDGNKLTVDSNILLTQILHALGSGSCTPDQTALLKDMLAKLDEIIKNQQTADENRKKENTAVVDLLTAILDKMGTCGAEMNAKLDAIIQKIDAGNMTLESIKDILKEIANQFPAIHDKLQEILDKIPAGCHCDISAVIAEIQKIIIILSDNNTNEGVDDGSIDWSTLEGLLG